MITRSQIRRQLRSQGGIMNVVGRQKYGLGSFVRKAFGKAKDVVSNVVKSPIGKAAIIGLGGAGLMGMGPLAGLSGIGAKIGGLGKAGGLSSFFGKGSFNPLKMAMNPGGGGGLGLSSFGSLLGKVGLATDAGGLSTIGKVIGAGGLLGYFTSKGIAPEEAEQLSQDVYRGKGAGLDMIKADIQKYKSGESSESDMFAKGYNFLPERSRIRQGSADGGRIGLQSGGVSMSNTRAQNIAANQAQNQVNQANLNKGRDTLQATNLLGQHFGPGSSAGKGTAAQDRLNFVQKYFPTRVDQSAAGFHHAFGPGSTGVVAGHPGSYNMKDRASIINKITEGIEQDRRNRAQKESQALSKPRPKTYRTYSPEAQALNMDQSTYENIISGGNDPKQYYMDYQNRMMTEGQNYGTPGTSSYTGPSLLKYGQVIGGGPGGMMAGESPPTQAQLDAQMKKMQNNPQGFEDFDEVVKYYGSNDPYMGQKQEIKDMVGGVDTGYMSGADYYDQYVLGLDGQGIAEKYGIPYASGGRAGYDMGGLSTIERAKALFEERDEAAPAPSPGIGSIKQPSNEEKEMIQQFIEATSQDKGVRYTDPDGNEMTSKEFQDEMSRITELENMTMPKRKPKRAKGGMMNIPMGKPRKNAGGITELDYRASGGFVPVGIKEKADDVPAMLSKNEFVMTADAVRAAGGGSIEKGAQRMYNQMKQLEGKMA